MRRRWLALALLAWLASCAERPPDIVLVSIDSLRADRLGCYGADADTSPALDRLAREGARFAEVVAPTSWTLPSHATLLTGQSIVVHRVRGAFDHLDPRRETLAEHLSGLGYRTAGFVSSVFLHEAYGLDQGLAVYRNFAMPEGVSAEARPGREDHQRSHRLRSAGQVVDAAIAMLEDASGGDAPYFLFVHLWDPHYDYDPPADYRKRFVSQHPSDLDLSGLARNRAAHAGMSASDLRHMQALYDAEIRWTDDQIDRLLQAIDRSERDVIVSVVADHGEEFFEHDRKGHGRTLYEESVRVPWLLRHEGRVTAGTVVRGVAGLEDVAPTLLELAGLPPLPEATGVGRAAALARGETDGRPVLLELGGQKALRGSDWKVVLSPRGPLFYDLRADPGERKPQIALRVAPHRARELYARLAEDRERASSFRWQDDPQRPDLETQESLRALGYLVDDEDAP